LEPEEIFRRIHPAKALREFSTGQIDGPAFASAISELLGVPNDPDWLCSMWCDIYDEKTDVVRVARRVMRHHPTMILSNTNPWHWQRAVDEYPIVSEFPTHVVSFKVGAMKPETAIYEAALKQCKPGRPVVFIDDREDFASAAHRHGIHGIQFQTADQLERDLLALGCRLEPEGQAHD
jgi:FMN phosphatase YigB (HAD superfamily)